MPRARNIKPAFFENEFLGPLSGDIQLLFIGLWTQADREGVLELRIPKLRKALFGFRNDITDEIINRYLTVLERLDNGSMLVRVNHDGFDYLIIKNFSEHQSPHGTEKKKKLPLAKCLLSKAQAEITVKEPLEHGENPCQNALNPECGNLNPECGNLNHKNICTKNFEILKNLSAKDFETWLLQMEMKGNPITVDVSIEIEKIKSHYLAYNGLDKNGNEIHNWLSKAQSWILKVQQEQKNNRSKNNGRQINQLSKIERRNIALTGGSTTDQGKPRAREPVNVTPGDVF